MWENKISTIGQKGQHGHGGLKGPFFLGSPMVRVNIGMEISFVYFM